jgi:hypothetical protein
LAKEQSLGFKTLEEKNRVEVEPNWEATITSGRFRGGGYYWGGVLSS